MTPKGAQVAKYGLIAAVALAALAAGVLVQWQRTRLGPPNTRDAVLALTRAEFPDLSGKRTTVGHWQGKIVVVNFWATWCPPCRREIPGLVQIQERFAANGVQVVGIAVDQADKVAAYATEVGMTYPTLIAGIEAIDVARQLGNTSGALPFTVVLDRDGNVVETHLGMISEGELATVLVPLVD